MLPGGTPALSRALLAMTRSFQEGAFAALPGWDAAELALPCSWYGEPRLDGADSAASPCIPNLVSAAALPLLGSGTRVEVAVLNAPGCLEAGAASVSSL